MSFTIKNSKPAAISIDPQPAAKHFDIILGLDFHLLLIPPSPAPIPFPVIPFGALVFDPMDYIHVTLPAMPAFVDGKFTIQKNVPMGGTVLINGFYRAAATSALMGMPPTVPPIMGKVKALGSVVKKLTPLHMVVPKTNFYIPFLAPHDGQVSSGSKTVWTQGNEQSTLMCQVFSCAHVGRVVLNNPMGFFNNYATAIIGVLPLGKPVMVGGQKVEHTFKLDDLLNALMFMGMMFAAKFAMKMLGKLLSKIMAAIESKFPGFAKFRNAVQPLICKYLGEPVDPASGHMTSYLQGFSLPGPIPFCWEANYYSDSNYDGPLGKNIYHSYDISLLINEDEGYVVMNDTAGRPIVFPPLPPGETFFNRLEKMELHRGADGAYFVSNKNGLYYYFNTTRNKDGHHYIRSIANRNGFAIRFEYDRSGSTLIKIIDSAGRIILVENNDCGMIRALRMQHPDKGDTWFDQVRYEYDDNGAMSAFYNAEGYADRLQWEDRHIIARTFKDGTTFSFEFDVQGKCTAALGPGGLYSYRFAYFENHTEVINSLGYKSIYFHQHGIVTRIINPQGGQKLYAYDEYNNLVSETDENGIVTTFEYDERGNIIRENPPAQGQVTNAFDDRGKLLKKVLASGATWVYEYDEAGNLIRTKNPEQASSEFIYKDGLLDTVINPAGGIIRLTYDTHYNISAVAFPDNSSISYLYDPLGRCIGIRHANGSRQSMAYDLNGNLVRAVDSDGNTRQMTYNKQGDITDVRNRFGQIKYEYDFFGNIIRKTHGGTSTGIFYNTEGQLTGVQNEAGEIFRFDLDANGRIVKEIDFDGTERSYIRDAGGRIVFIQKQEGRTISIDYNTANRPTNIIYADAQSEIYDYDSAGQLIYAKNQHAEVIFVRDIMGRVIEEHCNGMSVKSSYDAFGKRLSMNSSMGAKLNISYDSLTGLENSIQANSWFANIERDIVGQEVSRTLPGNVRVGQHYDESGRLTEQKIFSPATIRQRQYQWEGSRLTRLWDSVSGNKFFRHDAHDNLEEVIYGDGTVEFKIHDVLGNLFETKELIDRRYGRSGQLRKKRGCRYEYDGEGNMIKKELPDGNVWTYLWDGAGRLSKVTRPDGNEVNFTYDAFGRRLTKRLKKTITKFVWDGNVPLHEWKENAETGDLLGKLIDADSDKLYSLKDNADGITTWLFEPESFVPTAKIKGTRYYSIITDQIGTPFQMHDQDGAVFWKCDLNVFGKVRMQAGEQTSCPFRFQGQYEDTETGLYYNRFRYYDPGDGNFISKDPIGLAGNNTTLYGYVKDPNGWIDVFGLACAPKKGKKTNKTVNSGSDAPQGAGIYSFTDTQGNKYTGSTNDFQSRMNNHIADGRLAPGSNVEFTPIDPGAGRSDAGARRVRRFLEQKQIGLDNNGQPLPNQSSNTRAVSPEKWDAYTNNGTPDFNNSYFD